MLVYHYIKCENYEKAAEYSGLAAKFARKKGANDEAILFSEKKVFCVEKLTHLINYEENIIDARSSFSIYLMSHNFHDKANDEIGRAHV